jgi:hypothetical protein
MGPEQAQRIVQAILLGRRALGGTGAEIPAWLEEITLREMMLAKRIIERINRREISRWGQGGKCNLVVVPPDRLISAVHAMLQHDPADFPIVEDGRGLAVIVLRLAHLARGLEPPDNDHGGPHAG